MIDNDTHCLSPSFWRMIDIMPVAMGQIFLSGLGGGGGGRGCYQVTQIMDCWCPMSGQNPRCPAKWPNGEMAGHNFALFYGLQYTSKNLISSEIWMEVHQAQKNYARGYLVPHYFCPYFEAWITPVKTKDSAPYPRAHTPGFLYRKILMRKGHKSQGLGHHWRKPIWGHIRHERVNFLPF